LIDQTPETILWFSNLLVQKGSLSDFLNYFGWRHRDTIGQVFLKDALLKYLNSPDFSSHSLSFGPELLDFIFPSTAISSLEGPSLKDAAFIELSIQQWHSNYLYVSKFIFRNPDVLREAFCLRKNQSNPPVENSLTALLISKIPEFLFSISTVRFPVFLNATSSQQIQQWAKSFLQGTQDEFNLSLRRCFGNLLGMSYTGFFEYPSSVVNYLDNENDPNLLDIMTLVIENERGVYTPTDGIESRKLSERFSANAKNCPNDSFLAKLFNRLAEIYLQEAEREASEEDE